MTYNLQHYYLQQMGIEPWVLRPKDVCKEKALSKLASTAASCTRCALHRTRTNVVFARGNPNANLMIIGEAPGFNEDKQGSPFVGKAGILLRKMLHSVALSEADIYIANVLKCRPPNNRDPKAEEIEQCVDYLSQQIALVQPKLILAVGRFAGQFLLKSQLPLNKMRQSKHAYQGIPVLVSYHPAYLLRNPSDKNKSYKDLLLVKQLLHEIGMDADRMAR